MNRHVAAFVSNFLSTLCALIACVAVILVLQALGITDLVAGIIGGAAYMKVATELRVNVAARSPS